MIARRSFIGGACAGLAAACVPLEPGMTGRIAAELRILEAASGGTLGVAFVDSATGLATTYNADTLFPHCSSLSCRSPRCCWRKTRRGLPMPTR